MTPEPDNPRLPAPTLGQGAGAGRSGGVTPGEPDPPAWELVIRFVALFLLLQALVVPLKTSGVMSALMRATASIAGVCINATGVPATRISTEVFLAERVLRIDAECTALMLVLVYVALVVADSFKMRTRLLGVFIGVPVILGANVLRLVAVAHVSGHLDESAFALVHDYLFAVLMVGVVIGSWLYWSSYARRHAT